jgi:hypothetical protein
MKEHPDATQFAAANPITIEVPQTTYDADDVGLHDSAVEVPGPP